MSDAKAACGDCGDEKCTCGESIWNYLVRNRVRGIVGWNLGIGHPRGNAIAHYRYRNDDFDYGPVQKISDPPYAFPTAAPRSARKYPGECPCGIASVDCDYHKDAT